MNGDDSSYANIIFDSWSVLTIVGYDLETNNFLGNCWKFCLLLALYTLLLHINLLGQEQSHSKIFYHYIKDCNVFSLYKYNKFLF